MTLLLRAAGVTLLGLAAFHAVLWRTLHWSEDTAKLSPLNARVFAVHTLFVAFVLSGLGILSMLGPHLLLRGDPLAVALTSFIVVFWLLRLVLQWAVFDRVMWKKRSVLNHILRAGVSGVWATYAGIYAWVLWEQLR